ncbi:hypothetical protein CI102_5249 [Trichoderma harzianum]|nr:hypothetical protein CI102_5249 [Trichoderma harzianum]
MFRIRNSRIGRGGHLCRLALCRALTKPWRWYCYFRRTEIASFKFREYATIDLASNTDSHFGLLASFSPVLRRARPPIVSRSSGRTSFRWLRDEQRRHLPFVIVPPFFMCIPYIPYHVSGRC